MSGDISQVLGFDASGAIASIATLNKSLSGMAGRFLTVEKNLQRFNAAAAPVPTVLARIEQEAAATALTLGALNTRMADASRFAGALGRVLPGLGDKFTNMATGVNAAAAGLSRIKSDNIDQLTAKASRATAAVRELGSAAKQVKAPAVPQGGAQSTRLVIDPKTLSRIAQTQVLLRGLGEVTEAFHYAASSAVEFNAKVAEIRTISTEKNLDALKDSVAELAGEFNRPLTDVAEGYYQTLSNQVGNATESTKFLSTALKFGKVAVTETGDAVNLLAGAIHAFNRPTEEADEFAAKFFKTIELGRVRGSELAQSFPRIATVAHQLGVSFDEAAASFDTMTHKGVGASETATQISGAMTSLIKPSKDGAAAIRQLGFDSGDALVRAYGFQGALQKLVNTTDGSTTAISKLVPRVRGLSFVLAATGESANFYKDSLEKIKAASEGGLDTEFLRQMSTDAGRVTTELNRLKIYLTKDLGDSLLATAKDVLALTGGAEGLSTAITHLLPLLEFAGAAALTAGVNYGVTSLATLRLATATTTLGGAFRFAFGWAGVALTAYEAVSFAVDLANQAWEKRLKQSIDDEEKLLEIGRKAAALRIKTSEDETNKTLALVARRTAAIEQALDTEIGQAKTASDALIDNTKAGFKKLIDANDDYLGQIRRRVDTEKRLRESVTERLAEEHREKEKDDFEAGLNGKSDKDKAFAYTDAGVAAARKARDLRTNPNATQADLRAADRLEQESKGHFRQAGQIGEHLQTQAKSADTKVGRLGESLERQGEGLDDFNAGNAIRDQSRLDKQGRRDAIRQNRNALAAFYKKHPRLPSGGFAGQDDQSRAELEILKQNAKQRNIDRTTGKLQTEKQHEAQLEQDAAAVKKRLGWGRDAAAEADEEGATGQLKNIDAHQQQAEALAKKAQEAGKRLRELSDTYDKNANPFDKNGKPLAPDARADRLEKAHAAASKILDLGLDTGDSELDKQIADRKAAIVKKLTGEEIQNLQVAPGAIDKIFGQIQGALDDKTFQLQAKIKFATGDGHNPVTDGVLDTGELREGVSASAKRIEKLEADRATAGPVKKDIAAYSRQAEENADAAQYQYRQRGGKTFESIQNGIELYGSGLDWLFGLSGKRGGPKEREQEFNEIRKQVKLASKQDNLTPESISDLENRLKRLSDPEEFGFGAGGFGKSRPGIQLQQAIESLKNLQAKQEQLKGNQFLAPGGEAELNRRKAEQRAMETEAKATADQSASLNQATGPAAKIAQLANWTANGYERGARAANKIRPLTAPEALKDGNDLNLASNGGAIRRFAAGGFAARGTDTIPAMLSPEEVVWNANTSRNFFGQLTAMNAGSSAPSSYGSSITHTGDIHISVPGGPTNAASASNLRDALTRLMRRRG